MSAFRIPNVDSRLPIPRIRSALSRVERWAEDAQLTEIETEILIGVYLHGYTLSEMGRRFGLSQSTMSRYKRRACSKLKDYFNERPIFRGHCSVDNLNIPVDNF